MIRNYFKIAWRNLKKHRFYTLINLLGLFTGIAFTLLIGVYVWGELQVNRKFKNADRQYILLSDWKEPNMGIDFTSLAPLAKQLKEDYPHLVKSYYRFDGVTSIVSKGDLSFRKSIQLGDSSLLTMYNFKLLHGDSKTALSDPYSVVITKNMALQFFGTTDAIGKTIAIENFGKEKHPFKITGVLDKLPKNSITNINRENSIENDLSPELFLSKNANTFFGRGNFTSWSNIYIPSFIELNNGVTIKDLENPIKNLIGKNASKEIQQNLVVKPTLLSTYYLERDNAAIKRMLYTLSIIGGFILLMAVINFINISISMSGSRIKEIGVRKVLGSKRKQLIFQFLTESFVLVSLSTVLAFGAFIFLRPVFSQLLGADILNISSFSYNIILVFVGFISLLSVLAGLYPAFILSSLRLIQSLKGTLQVNNTAFQRYLVGFQFSIALLLLISASIITRQVDYFFEKDLGYNKDYILTVQTPRDWTDKGVEKMEAARSEFEKMSQITKASVSYEIPNGNFGNNFSIHNLKKTEVAPIVIKSLVVDEHYFSTYQVTLKDSLNTHIKPKHTVSINEAAAIVLGWKNPTDAIGEKIKVNGGEDSYTIQNIVGDFHFDTMKQEIQPLVFFNLKTFPIYRYMNFRIVHGDLQNTITLINQKWNTLFPDSVFDYEFIDESLSKLYASEIRFKKAVYYASLLSFIIVLLGIVGLVSLNIHKRVKEMGIRKVLGASIFNIIRLFTNEFIRTIVIASVIAIPIAYYFINSWLNSYAYRVELSLMSFTIPILLLILVVFVIIGLLSLKTAKANPTKSLRAE